MLRDRDFGAVSFGVKRRPTVSIRGRLVSFAIRLRVKAHAKAGRSEYRGAAD